MTRPRRQRLLGRQVGVVHPMAQARIRARFLRSTERGDSNVLRLIATCVDVDSLAVLVRPLDVPDQVIWRTRPHTPVLGLALVRLVHLCGAITTAAAPPTPDALAPQP